MSIPKSEKDGSAHFENQALHCLCGPKSLENQSLKEFVECMEVKQATKKNTEVADNPVVWFLEDCGPFKHPLRKETKKGSGILTGSEIPRNTCVGKNRAVAVASQTLQTLDATS